jgi:hypothetical protein
MKIIDFERQGNVVRFYLGADDCTNYWGDDWNDAPYDCNAGTVYSDFVKGHCDIAFPFGVEILEPCNGVVNCNFSKEDMKNRAVPCIIAVPEEVLDNYWASDDFYKFVGNDKVKKFYFGDEMEPNAVMETFVW